MFLIIFLTQFEVLFLNDMKQYLNYLFSSVIDNFQVSKTGINLEPRCEKTGLWGFRPGRTQTGLYSHIRWLDP